jgi:hypothetical protein
LPDDPALEAVLDCFTDLAIFGDLGALLAQPSLQLSDERPTPLLVHAHAFLRRLAVDLALDGEQNIHALDGLDRDRRLVEPGEIKELAPRVLVSGDTADYGQTSADRSLAEGVGFEPTRERKPPGGFQDRCLKPLGHPSLSVKSLGSCSDRRRWK